MDNLGIYQLRMVEGKVFQIFSEPRKASLPCLEALEADCWLTTFTKAIESITKKDAAKSRWESKEFISSTSTIQCIPNNILLINEGSGMLQLQTK